VATPKLTFPLPSLLALQREAKHVPFAWLRTPAFPSPSPSSRKRTLPAVFFSFFPSAGWTKCGLGAKKLPGQVPSETSRMTADRHADNEIGGPPSLSAKKRSSCSVLLPPIVLNALKMMRCVSTLPLPFLRWARQILSFFGPLPSPRPKQHATTSLSPFFLVIDPPPCEVFPVSGRRHTPRPPN